MKFRRKFGFLLWEIEGTDLKDHQNGMTFQFNHWVLFVFEIFALCVLLLQLQGRIIFIFSLLLLLSSKWSNTRFFIDRFLMYCRHFLHRSLLRTLVTLPRSRGSTRQPSFLHRRFYASNGLFFASTSRFYLSPLKFCQVNWFYNVLVCFKEFKKTEFYWNFSLERSVLLSFLSIFYFRR
jgi:hypothetical protein